MKNSLIEVKETLIKAKSAEGEDRSKILQSLYLKLVQPSEEENSKESPLLFEILADYYKEHPEEVFSLKPLCVVLWSSSTFPAVFVLLFYKWIFDDGFNKIKTLNLFLIGVNRLFWVDLEKKSRRFAPIYWFLKEKVLFDCVTWKDAFSKTLLDYYQLISRFLFYYQHKNVKEAVVEFLSKIESQIEIYDLIKQEEEILNQQDDFAIEIESFGYPLVYEEPEKRDSVKEILKIENMNSRGADLLTEVFVLETLRHINLIKNEDILVRYFECFSAFEGIKIEPSTAVKLRSVIYRYTTPGGPLYPTRRVRQTARVTMDNLFPHGKVVRKIVYSGFRLLQPYYTTDSFIYWFKTNWIIFLAFVVSFFSFFSKKKQP